MITAIDFSEYELNGKYYGGYNSMNVMKLCVI